MSDERRSSLWWQILLALCLLVPLALIFLVPGGGWLRGGLWFWLFLLLCIWMIWMMVAAPASGQEAEETGPRMLHEAEQPDAVREVMDVRVATEHAAGQVFRGRLRYPADETYERLKERLREGTVPLVQQDEELGAAIVLMPAPVEQATMERPVRPWLHWLLFGLTFLTTTWDTAGIYCPYL